MTDARHMMDLCARLGCLARVNASAAAEIPLGDLESEFSRLLVVCSRASANVPHHPDSHSPALHGINGVLPV